MPRREKSMLDIMKQVRQSWNINPRTKIKEDERKNIKKRRQDNKKLTKEPD